MTKEEFKKFFRYISAVTTDNNPSAEKTQVYWDALNDLPFNIAMAAARKVITTLENPFLPMPAVFRGVAIEIIGPKIPMAPDAYGEVMRSIRNFGVYREKEALEAMSPLVQQVVKAIGWKEICLSEEPDVIRGQFRMAYETLQKREITDAKTPQSLKTIMAGITKYQLTDEDNVITEKLLEQNKELIESLERKRIEFEKKEK